MTALDEEFYATLRSMERLSGEPSLTDSFPPASTHNEWARILRLGIAISAFALLEKYVEGKFGELMQNVSLCSVPYVALPSGLRQFITLHAVGGLANRASFMDRGDALVFVEGALSQLSSFSSVPATYTALGFSPRGSNVGEDDIEKAFKSLGVGSVWSNLSAITGEIGGGRLSLKVDYGNLARTRHRSAHSPSHNLPTSDLLTHLRTAALIGVAIAVLATLVGRAYRSATTSVDLTTRLGTLVRQYRFLDEEAGGTWVERVTLAGRPMKRYPSRTAAIAGAATRSGARIVVLRDPSSVPVGVA